VISLQELNPLMDIKILRFAQIILSYLLSLN